MIPKFLAMLLILAALLLDVSCSRADEPSAQIAETPGRVPIRQVVVVRPDEPNPVEQWAAEDLALYLGRIADCEVPVTGDASLDLREGQFPIYLGRTAPGRKLLKESAPLGPDEFIMAGGPDGDRLVVVGKDLASSLNGPGNMRYREWPTAIKGISNRCNLGTCRGVWYLLRELAGVRWYQPGPDGEVVPASKTLALPEKLPLRIQPDFEIRSLRAPMRDYNTEEFCRWYYRVGFGMPGRLIIANHTMPTIGRWITAGHGSEEMIANRNGSRSNHYFLCHNHPDLPKLFFDRLMRYPRQQNMDPTSLPVMPADGFRASHICQCDRCQADREEGLRRMKREQDEDVPFHNRSNTSHYTWPLVLKVAEIARTESPESYVTCCAYASYGAPPKEPETFPENVGVQICKERLMYMDPDRRQRDRQRIAAWSEKVNAISVWEYYCFHMWGNPIPLVCPRNIADDLHFLKGKVLGEQIEIESLFHYNMNHSGLIAMDGLNVYVTARFMLDADQDIDAVLNDYYRNFFGPAENTMQEFFENLEDQWAQNPQAGRDSDKYDLAFAEDCMARLEEAKSQVPAESVYARRIDALIDDFTPWLTLVQQKTRPGSAKLASAETVTVDGTLGEAAWDNAPAMTYTLNAGHAERGGFPDYLDCTTRILRGPDALYLAARIGTHYKHPYAKQFGSYKKYEQYQAIFAAPDGKRYVLTIDGAGKADPRLYPKAGSAKNSDWNAHLNIAQQRLDDEWLLEIRIPYAAFGPEGMAQRGQWKFNSHILTTYVDPQRLVMNPHIRKKRGNPNYIVSIRPRVKDPRGQGRRYRPDYYLNLTWDE